MSATEETQQLWGGETTKAVENFQISGERVPPSVIHWLGRIKGAAARVNADLDLLDSDVAERIAAAAEEVGDGRHDDQFPIDVFQTGSGTSSNMNANEVIANLAGDGAHPNDHVNYSPSSHPHFLRAPPPPPPPPPPPSPRSTTRRTACCPRSSSSSAPSPRRPTSSRTSSRPAARTSWTPSRSRS